MSSILLIFTSKQRDDIIELGGTGWWKVDPVKARKATHVILVHNAHDRMRSGDPDRHGQSFMIATIRDVVQDEDGRWLIQFDEFATTDAGVEWPGYRNPVTYVDSDEILGQLTLGDWKKMAPVSLDIAKGIRRRDDASVSRMEARTEASSTIDPVPIGAMTFGQIIDHHRALLANDLGVDLGAVRISIETS
ncbi:hypothetical protein [uncultured Tateyamaria sp.]|uniref:hypothetical protein n=1 Tax=uncultured Tateyamaria sp. TaxID=455651 RepID=UPI002611F603|nr:hypothetical protein [uncultured Tateyamaria sp.]